MSMFIRDTLICNACSVPSVCFLRRMLSFLLAALLAQAHRLRIPAARKRAQWPAPVAITMAILHSRHDEAFLTQPLTSGCFASTCPSDVLQCAKYVLCSQFGRAAAWDVARAFTLRVAHVQIAQEACSTKLLTCWQRCGSSRLRHCKQPQAALPQGRWCAPSTNRTRAQQCRSPQSP